MADFDGIPHSSSATESNMHVFSSEAPNDDTSRNRDIHEHLRNQPRVQMMSLLEAQSDLRESARHMWDKRLIWPGGKQPRRVMVVKKWRDPTLVSCFKKLTSWLIEEMGVDVYAEQSVLREVLIRKDKKFRPTFNKLKPFNASGSGSKHRYDCGESDGAKDHDDDDDADDDDVDADDETKVQYYDNIIERVNIILCLGGDGTILYVASLFRDCKIPPVVSFHLGSMGFLTPFNFEDYQNLVRHIFTGHARVTLRSRLACRVVRRAKLLDSSAAAVSSISENCSTNVLNEIVIDRGQSSYLSDLEVYVDDQLITTVQADGLIIATPTGSTAYSLSAGGSMMHPHVPAILLTPICPHSLSFRPIVLPDTCVIKVVVPQDSRNTAWAAFDGRNRIELQHGDAVIVKTSKFPIFTVSNSDQSSDWFDSISRCLSWNFRLKQKPMEMDAPRRRSLESAYQRRRSISTEEAETTPPTPIDD